MQNFKMKKILAEVLAASMILTSFSVPAMAAEAEDLVEDTAIVEEAVVDASEEDVVGDGTTYKFDSKTTAIEGVAWAKKAVIVTGGTKKLDDYFSVVAEKDKSVIYGNTGSDLASSKIELPAEKGGYLEFTTEGTASVTVKVYSTGKDNTSDLALYVGDNQVEGTYKTVTGTSGVVYTFENLEPATYKLLTPGNGDYKRGVRFDEITVVEEAKAADPTDVKHNVSFAGGKEAKSIEVVSGNKVSSTISADGIAALEPTVAEGQTFAGWKSSADNKVYSSADVANQKINAETTFTAVVTTAIIVTFKWTHSDTTTKEEAEETKTVTLPEGTAISGEAPQATTRYCYRFQGWSADGGQTIVKATEIGSVVPTAAVTYEGIYEKIADGDTTPVKPVTKKMVYNVGNFVNAQEADWSAKNETDTKDRRYLLNENLALVANYAANGSATSKLTRVVPKADGTNGLSVYDNGNATEADQAIVDTFEYLFNLKCRITGDVDWKNVSTGVMSPYTDGYYEFETSEPSEVVVYWAAAGTSKTYELVLCDATKSPAVDGEDFFVDYDILDGAAAGSAVAKTVFNVDKAQKYWISTANHDQANGAKIYRIEVTPKSAQGSDDPTPAPGGEDGNDDSNTSVSKDSVTSTGDPALTPATAAEVSANYAKLVAGDASVGYKAAVGDTGVLKYVFKKGKVKAISVSTNSVSACKVTLNAKTKVILPSDYANTVGTISGNAGVKPVKVNKKGYASLKASKSAAKYDVVFKNAKGETITITVVNLGFDKGLKKLMVSPSQNLIVRPTLMTGKTTDIKQGAGFLNGVWTVDKTVISKPGQTVSGKKGAKVTLNANGTVTVTNVAGKGSVKLTYTLNGKKYTTAIKVQKKASGAESTYTAAGLLK